MTLTSLVWACFVRPSLALTGIEMGLSGVEAGLPVAGRGGGAATAGLGGLLAEADKAGGYVLDSSCRPHPWEKEAGGDLCR